MKNTLLKTTLAFLTLLAPALPARAQEEASAPRKAESRAAKDARSAKAKETAKKARVRAKEKAEAEAKAVDVNSATKEQLKTLPGITDAYADKIIAGRPYLSKAFLVTKNVLPQELYLTIRKRIVARQAGAKPQKR
ncbi:ComEA family DNA-binding protein [Geothrix alkalitolerans]|uniref:ComEA family DNA-binding protein n=1 Tax=Geothrix alkalitolerans TaxID=2922724 RepID=UPI001FAF4A68|nr:helix-hairpin-helix domain-containing protein [Geothrix alkalitolerans]